MNADLSHRGAPICASGKTTKAKCRNEQCHIFKEMNICETLWTFVSEDIAILLKLDVATHEGNEK